MTEVAYGESRILRGSWNDERGWRSLL